ncbi:MAG: hypothetical protein ACI91B_002878 [Planctomycetota bacterium]|jgi:hypothetical protein
MASGIASSIPRGSLPQLLLELAGRSAFTLAETNTGIAVKAQTTGFPNVHEVDALTGTTKTRAAIARVNFMPRTANPKPKMTPR